LDLHGVGLLRQPQEAAEALDVRVHDHAFVFSEPSAEDDVGGLATDAGQRGELFHCLGHLAAVPFDERLGHADDRLGLVPEEAGGLNLFLEHAGIGGRVGGGGAVLREQMRRHHVHPRISALRRENGSDRELEGALVVQRARGIRVIALQAPDDLPSARLPFGCLCRGHSRRHMRLWESSSVRSRHVSSSSSPAFATEYRPAAMPPASLGPNGALPSSRAAAISISLAPPSSLSARPSKPTALKPGRSGRMPKMASTAIVPGSPVALTNIPSSGSGALPSLGDPHTRSSGSCRYCAACGATVVTCCPLTARRSAASLISYSGC